MSRTALLCIDASTAAACVGLVGDGELLAARLLQEKRRHAERMYEAIEEVLAEAELSLDHVDAVVVGLGPGSFIGVRVAVATAKGLALGADLPLIGVSTLAAVAISAGVEGRLAVALDAKKGQVYAAVYDVEEQTQPIAVVVEPRAIDPSPCAELLQGLQPIHALLGDGFTRYPETFARLGLLEVSERPPGPLALAALAADRLSRRDFDEPSALVPTYVRRSEAEEKRETQRRAAERAR